MRMLNGCKGSRVSRRRLLATAAAAAGAAAAGLPRTGRAQAVLTEDGLLRQPWFLDSLLELGDDLEAATGQGRRFALLWELRGCPYCKKMHEVNFARPEIVDFVRARFDILQLNIIGDREVVDFDCERLPEKRLAAKYGVRGTPTWQFLPEAAADLGRRPPRAREVARASGYIEPQPFLAMFRFVLERGYERGSLAEFLKSAT
jgi:thioredoxin-related protein